jgi:hypothetical protein
MPINGDTTDQDDIQVRQKTTQEECNRLREENERLRAILGIDHSLPGKPVSQAVSVAKPSSIATSEVYTPEKKIALFRNLFHGREDVFAVRWEGKGGKSGYSPAGSMDWRAIHAAKPEDLKGRGSLRWPVLPAPAFPKHAGSVPQSRPSLGKRLRFHAVHRFLARSFVKTIRAFPVR